MMLNWAVGGLRVTVAVQWRSQNGRKEWKEREDRRPEKYDKELK